MWFRFRWFSIISSRLKKLRSKSSLIAFFVISHLIYVVAPLTCNCTRNTVDSCLSFWRDHKIYSSRKKTSSNAYTFFSSSSESCVPNFFWLVFRYNKLGLFIRQRLLNTKEIFISFLPQRFKLPKSRVGVIRTLPSLEEPYKENSDNTLLFSRQYPVINLTLIFVFVLFIK